MGSFTPSLWHNYKRNVLVQGDLNLNSLFQNCPKIVQILILADFGQSLRGQKFSFRLISNKKDSKCSSLRISLFCMLIANLFFVETFKKQECIECNWRQIRNDLDVFVLRLHRSKSYLVILLLQGNHFYKYMSKNIGNKQSDTSIRLIAKGLIFYDFLGQEGSCLSL